RSDEGAVFDYDYTFNCDEITPQVTWGTSPEQVVGIDGQVPAAHQLDESRVGPGLDRAYEYMDLQPGTHVEGLEIAGAFIGSCTNGRLSDLKEAAKYLKGRQVAPGIMAICTPGSMEVKKQAEEAGIAQVFTDAGFEWREPGCSFCMSGGAGGESFEPSSRIISSTNRNFEGRQGRDVRSHLASPATVAWSAIHGKISDIREFEELS
ncbi:MAG: aconitase family protein, partial [Gammaproteobacteria bacterium]